MATVLFDLLRIALVVEQEPGAVEAADVSGATGTHRPVFVRGVSP